MTEITITEQELKELTSSTPTQQAAKDAAQRYRERVDELATLQRKITRMSNSIDTDPAELARLTAEAKALETILPNLQRAVAKTKATASVEARAQEAEAQRPAMLRQRLAAIKADRQALNAESQIAVWQGNIRQLQSHDKALAEQIAGLEAALQQFEAGQV